MKLNKINTDQRHLLAYRSTLKNHSKLVNIFKFFFNNKLAMTMFGRQRNFNQASMSKEPLELLVPEELQLLTTQPHIPSDKAVALFGRLNSAIEHIRARSSNGNSSDTSLLPNLVKASLAIAEKIEPDNIRVNAIAESVRRALNCMKLVDPASAESLFRCAKLYAETHLPKGHEIMKEIYDAALDYQPTFAADCLELLEPNVKLSSCQSLLNRLAQQATLDTPTLNSALTVARKTLPSVALEETSFVDQVVAEVLHLNPHGLDVALTAATVMKGNPQTYIAILEKSLQVQPGRSAEICQVFLEKFQGQTDILETVISNLVERKKFEIAEFLMDQISEDEVKSHLQEVYLNKLNTLKGQNLQTQASEFAKQLAERLNKREKLDWDKVEQDIRAYSPDNRELQREFADEVYRRFLKIANENSSWREQVCQLRSVILAIKK